MYADSGTSLVTLLFLEALHIKGKKIRDILILFSNQTVLILALNLS